MTPAKILVVDDQPINIKLLQRKLEREGYDVHTAYNGLECIEAVQNNPPDLILLDVMMPEMDGIEACQRLKANEDTKSIPVIFITAKSSKEGKIEGLSAGGVDYITKPIDLDETLARVKTQLRLQEIFRENTELLMRLADSRKTAAIGAITQGIAHNLNNLLGVVVGYLDLLKNGYDSPDMVQRSVTLMDQAINRMVNIIRQLSTIATTDRVALSELNLNKLLEASIDRFKEEYGVDTVITITNQLPEDYSIHTNTEVLESIVGKLLINAWESYPKNEPDENREVWIETGMTTLEDGSQQLLIKVNDDGTGIAESIRDNIFEPFITTKTSVGRGLGLTMARHAIRNLKGDLDLEPRPVGGTCATISYPVSVGETVGSAATATS
ncbi:MAG: hybrid sensor histidine kinase/response regulator [Verrucomicrobiota bacterium]